MSKGHCRFPLLLLIQSRLLPLSCTLVSQRNNLATCRTNVCSFHLHKDVAFILTIISTPHHIQKLPHPRPRSSWRYQRVSLRSLTSFLYLPSQYSNADNNFTIQARIYMHTSSRIMQPMQLLDSFFVIYSSLRQIPSLLLIISLITSLFIPVPICIRVQYQYCNTNNMSTIYTRIYMYKSKFNPYAM